jgi:hypothetical protein
VIRYISLLLFIGLAFWSCGEDPESEDCSDTLSNELKEFADNNWTLDDWVTNRFAPPTHMYESMFWLHFPALWKLSGYHDLSLLISGNLANYLNLTQVSSDTLEVHPEWVETGDITILRDSLFYVNIGKYNQFVGGWADATDNWYWEEIDVGDSTEIVITTPLKDYYLEMFPNCD